MSMPVVFIKILADFHRRIVESEGELLDEVGNEEVEEEGFDRERDSYDELDYRDIQGWAEDSAHPLHALFHGEALHEEYGWSYGQPMYFDPPTVAGISQRFESFAGEQAWQMQGVAEFLARAALEGKGLIVGVA